MGSRFPSAPRTSPPLRRRRQASLWRSRIGPVPKAFGLAIAGFVLVMRELSLTTTSYIDRDIEENAGKLLEMAINKRRRGREAKKHVLFMRRRTRSAEMADSWNARQQM